MPSDMIQVDFGKVKEPIVWCKMTVASFRWLDLHEIYRDLGFDPAPLLIVRDVRSTYSSLLGKWYGFNGVTAEDPPLRMRFRRFLRDWELFRERGWPILKYEDLMVRQRACLMETCEQIGLDWDEGMVTWPKRRTDVAYIGKLNRTFEQSMEKGTLAKAILSGKAEVSTRGLPESEHRWLEDTFASYNKAHDYSAHVPSPIEYGEESTPLPAPRYEGSVRDWLYSEKSSLETELYRLQGENERLLKELAATQRSDPALESTPAHP